MDTTEFFKEIVGQALKIELRKKELSKNILLNRSDKHVKIFLKFLQEDLDKHRLFEKAAVFAIQNRTDGIHLQLKNLYPMPNYHEKEVLDIIRSEIINTKACLKIVQKKNKKPDLMTFVEKRFYQEISKYIIEQAKCYKDYK